MSVADVLSHQILALTLGGAVLALAVALGLGVRWQARTRAQIARLRADLARQEAAAGTDALTGLASRARFMERLGDGARQEAKALILLDVDGLKSVNDTYGHASGDALLERIGAIIATICPPQGLAARLGGDEFAIVVPGMALPDARALAETLRARVADTVLRHKWQDVTRTVSCGVSVLRPDTPLDDAMSEADTALYAAKERGRNRVVAVDAGLHDRWLSARAEPTLEEMRKGVEAEEFTYYVQPIYSLRSNRPVGVEALIRWVQADGTVRLPGEFMHMFAGPYRGAIRPPLGAADAVVAAFREDGNEMFCAFNIAPSFLRASFEPSRGWLDDLLMGLAPGQVVFEIAESNAIENQTAARKMLEFLRGHGVRVALDDFATGYSNLDRLVELPVDLVKTDRVLTARLPQCERRYHTMSALLELSDKLGFEIIAEGVETELQLAALRELQVPMAQGFLLGRPQSLHSWQNELARMA